MNLHQDKRKFLGIDAGGTRTVAVLVDVEMQILERKEFGPANLRLVTNPNLLRHFRQIASAFPPVEAIGIGMAGARGESDRNRIRSVANQVWGEIPLHVGHDLETALAADDRPTPENAAKILVLSGTGSCCFGRNRSGQSAKVGGWGHYLGDVGSGYDISFRALREVVYHFERGKTWSRLGELLLSHLLLNVPEELIGWIQEAQKSAVAALASVVFQAAQENDRLAKRIITEAGELLAQDALTCAARLTRKGSPAVFLFSGSVLVKQPEFARRVALQIRKGWPKAVCRTAHQESAWGAAILGMAAWANVSNGEPRSQVGAQRSSPTTAGQPELPEFDPRSSPTEQRNPRSVNLHRMSNSEILSLMLTEEVAVAGALEREKPTLQRLVELASKALRGGGRIFYVGAGTSGRLGVLDASECPPTFRANPEMVQGIMAGGQRALWQAVEGAEDDYQAGADAIGFRRVRKGDFVLGIAASGRTPFVWGAISAAKRVGAKTALLCFNPSIKIAPRARPDVVLAPNLGPEILTGSTRLKSGTATKLVLNMISTISMVRLGKVIGNLMVDLNPSNVKLRDRAVRIVQELTGTTAETARAALEQHGWVVKKAWESLQKAKRRKST